MSASMAAMMVPTAAPFFFAYGRDTRRPVAVAITVVIYVAVWAAIGALANLAMNQVMIGDQLLRGFGLRRATCARDEKTPYLQAPISTAGARSRVVWRPVLLPLSVTSPAGLVAAGGPCACSCVTSFAFLYFLVRFLLGALLTRRQSELRSEQGCWLSVTNSGSSNTRSAAPAGSPLNASSSPP